MKLAWAQPQGAEPRRPSSCSWNPLVNWYLTFQDNEGAVRIIQGDEIFRPSEGELFPLYAGTPPKGLSRAVAEANTQRQCGAAKWAAWHLGPDADTEDVHSLASSADVLLASQLRLDVLDALQCMQSSSCLNPLLRDAVARFLLISRDVGRR